MATIKGLVEEFAKLTGELKTEGTIDINFFSNQITEFANIIMTTIHKLDEQMGLNHQLEYNFGREFKKQWDLYKDTFGGHVLDNYEDFEFIPEKYQSDEEYRKALLSLAFGHETTDEKREIVWNALCETDERNKK